VSESNVSELEITEAEGKVRIVKAPPTVIQAAAPMVVASAPAAAVMAAPAQVAAAVPLEAAAPAVTGHMVKSPMVGTFYRASNPGAKPLADVGQQVKEGQALCIIEAMKIMNEIDSDKAGVITKVLVENGQPVEYGQPLFIIE
jgi:acetyl-CoA carboxylase biotin carboxyl carrier protein